MKNSILIFSFFVLGIILGIYRWLPDYVITGAWSTYILYALLFLIGITIGGDKNAVTLIKQLNYKIFLVPFGIILGTLGGAWVLSFIYKGLTSQEILAVSAGFGWYSLSSIFISKLHNEALGLVALMSNFIREIITLLATSLLVKYFGKLAGITSGGATSMDTTLPVIVRYSGKEFAMISIFSGIILTLLVPFLVTFILEF